MSRLFALKFRRLLSSRLHLTDTQMQVVAAVAIGVCAGLGAYLFRFLISLVYWIFFEVLADEILDSWEWGFIKFKYLLIPAMGGLLVGPLIYFGAREAKGHGIPEIMYAIRRTGGQIRGRVAAVKILASAITIGTGGGVGREGPIAQIGAAMASAMGQFFRVPKEMLKIFVACGAGGGIAATFNAPMSGVIFAMEVLLGGFKSRSLSLVLISCASATVVGHALIDEKITFKLPFFYGMENIYKLYELPLFAILGMLAGVTALFFVEVLYKSEDFFEKLRFPEMLKPVLGGLLVGCILMVFHQVKDQNYETLSSSLGSVKVEDFRVSTPSEIAATENPVIEEVEKSGGFPSELLLSFGLIFIFAIAAAATLGSGGSGGVFTPALAVGTMTGATFGLLAQFVFGNSISAIGIYALVGMASGFAGAAHMPFTSIFIIFEMTRDYRLILPIMIATTLSTLVAQKLHPDSIFTRGLRQRGVNPDDVQANPLANVLASEVMIKKFDVINISTPLPQLLEVLESTHLRAFPVTDGEGHLAGIATAMDINNALTSGLPIEFIPVIDIMSSGVSVAFPDETVDVVLERMRDEDLDMLPIVSRDDMDKVLGLITHRHVIDAYHHALVQQSKI
jgi:chloride channel protein, CIC family